MLGTPLVGPALRYARIYFDILCGGQRRSEALLTLRRPPNLFQPQAYTNPEQIGRAHV